MIDKTQQTEKPFKIGELVVFYGARAEGLFIVLELLWNPGLHAWVIAVLSQRTGIKERTSAINLDPAEWMND